MKQLKKIVAIAAVSAGIMGVGVASAASTDALIVYNKTKAQWSSVKIGAICTGLSPVGRTGPGATNHVSAKTVSTFCGGKEKTDAGCKAKIYVGSQSAITLCSSGDTGCSAVFSNGKVTISGTCNNIAIGSESGIPTLTLSE